MPTQNNDQHTISKDFYDKALRQARQTATTKGKSRSLGDKLFGLFGLRVNRDSKDQLARGRSLAYGMGNRDDIEKLNTFRDPRTGQQKSIPTQLSGELGKLFNAYVSDTYESTETLRDKQERYNSLDFMYNNDPFISAVADMMADEATQVDQQENLITAEGVSQEHTDYIYKCLNEWDINHQKAADTIFNIGYYGDGLWGLKVTDQGILGVKPVHPRMLYERIEFNPLKVKERLEDLHQGWQTQRHRDAKISKLLDMIEADKIQDFADLFDTYLFGFDIAGEIVPPWSAYHFRLNPSRSEFFPYGKSNFQRALAPFKQMSSSYILQAMARIMSFPVREMKVHTTGSMSEADQFDRINKVREMYENQGYDFPDIASDPYSLMSTIWSSDGLMDLNIHESKVELDFVGDIELLTDRVAIASGAPKGYLVQEWGGFGNSGVSLTEQHKPFARRVYSLQTAFLDGLSDIIRLHMAITGDFDHTEPFKLTMNFPNTEVDESRVNIKSSTLQLATDVLDTISSVMGVDGPLPFEVAKDVMMKLSFVDGPELDKWMNLVRKDNVEAEDEEGEEEGDEDMGGIEALESTMGDYLRKSRRLYEGKRGRDKARRITEQYKEIRSNVLLKASVRHRLTEGQNGTRHYRIANENSVTDPMKIVFQAVTEAREDTSGKLHG